MRRLGTQWFSFATSLAMTGAVWGAVADAADAPETSERSYEVIIVRNPFGLKDPPPPQAAPPPAPAPEQPKSDISLTGITTLLQPKRAYLMTKDPKGEAKYYSLAETESRDGLQVMEINEREKSVRVKTGDQIINLTFATHGIKAPTGPAPAAPGGRPGAAPHGGAPPPLPGGAAVMTPTGMGTAGNRPAGVSQIPPRQLRGSPAGYMAPGMAAGPRMGYSAAPDLGTENRNVVSTVPPDQPQFSAEEQIAIMQAQQALHNAARPDIPLPPIPPSLPGPGQGYVPPPLPQ